MKTSNLIVLLIIITSQLFAQSDNLVENPSFDLPLKEGKEIKVKENGEIEEALFWSSPTEVKADLYSSEAKSEHLLVPLNGYGREEAEEGCCYAGIMAYSYKEKFPRTYLQGQLKQHLEKDQFYCVSFNVSLADLSKYAVNGIGAHFSKFPLEPKKINQNKVVPQVMHYANKVYEDQYYWEDVCAMIKAEGSEKYITIGNFEIQDSILYKKMKKSRQFTQPQTFDSYYYIENISVVKTDSSSKCKCKSLRTKDQVKKVEVLYTKDESGNLEDNPELIIEQMFIPFNPKSKLLNSSTKLKADKIAKILAEKPGVKLKISGHTDKIEQKLMDKIKTDLGLQRAEAVKKYLISKGVKADQISIESLKDTQSTYTKDLKEQKKYMKATFSLL